MQPRARIISEHFATSEIYNREIGRLQPRLKDGPGGCGTRLCGGPEKLDRKPRANCIELQITWPRKDSLCALTDSELGWWCVTPT